MPLKIKQKSKKIPIVIIASVIMVAGGGVTAGAVMGIGKNSQHTKDSAPIAANTSKATNKSAKPAEIKPAAEAPKPAQPTAKPPQQAVAGSSSSRGVLMDLSGLYAGSNAERNKAKLAPYNRSPKLEQSACMKVDDMINKDYFAHNGPDGSEPWTFIHKVGYGFGRAGENIAAGQPDSASVIAGWMNSQGHRSNILGSFREVGMCMKSVQGFQGGKYTTVTVAHYAIPL